MPAQEKDGQPFAKKRVIFLHPDLGIGGAERLVVDAACALADKGHDVTIYTSHFDPQHAFRETAQGKFKVVVHGDFLPRALFKRFHIVFAMLRSIYLALCVAALAPADIFICDQISLYVAILRVLRRSPTIFYCHFPDKLLAERGSFLRTLYRMPFDLIEEWSTGCADVVLANSHFTKQIFRQHFRWLSFVDVDVLHPATRFGSGGLRSQIATTIPPNGAHTFLSINRYERKKNIGLSLQALAALREIVGQERFAKVRLVIAGGFDHQVAENVEHHAELQKLALHLDLTTHVHFIRSFSDKEKASLLRNCVAVLYTPDKEHFGIVPLECMAAGRPVVAVNSGGPTETVVHERTGFLCSQDPQKWAKRMAELLADVPLAEKMGTAGKMHVADNFSFGAFQRKLLQHVKRVRRSQLRCFDVGFALPLIIPLMVAIFCGVLW